MTDTPSVAGARLLAALVLIGAAVGAVAALAPPIAWLAGPMAISLIVLTTTVRVLLIVRTWELRKDTPYLFALAFIVAMLLLGLAIGSDRA